MTWQARIEPSILFKKGPLSFWHWQERIQTHPQLGHDIVKSQQKPALMLRDHHERWDGTGYPRGYQQEYQL